MSLDGQFSSCSDKEDIALNGDHLPSIGMPRKDTQQLMDKAIRDTIIDMSSYDCRTVHDLRDNNQVGGERYECCTKLTRTLQSDGFALVRGLDIPASLCNDALRVARSFLHEADESVRRSCLTKDRARRGYSPMCTENFASLIGEKGPNDIVKKFRIGPESENANHRQQMHPISSLHQPNQWPTGDFWSQDQSKVFKSVMREYYERMCKVADVILQAISEGILNENKNVDVSESMRVLSGLTTATLTDVRCFNELKNHSSILTLLGYQPGSRHKKGHPAYMRPLVSAHTDVGVITVLHFDSGKCAALERALKNTATCGSRVSTENIEWVEVQLPALNNNDDDPVFVVNVGDCLSELSGGALRSTLHRVMPRTYSCLSEYERINADEMTRTCLALFVGLEPSASLKLPQSDEVLTYEEWRRQRVARAKAILKNEK